MVPFPRSTVEWAFGKNCRLKVGERPKRGTGAVLNRQGSCHQERSSRQLFQLGEAFNDQNAVGQPMTPMAGTFADNPFHHRYLAANCVGSDGANAALCKKNCHAFIHAWLIPFEKSRCSPVPAMPTETDERHLSGCDLNAVALFVFSNVVSRENFTGLPVTLGEVIENRRAE